VNPRERDAAWDGHNRLTPMADRHDLMAAGDKLAAAAAKHINDPRSTPPWHAELHRALLDWKEATG
jgi:hypothetical protein